jgi:YgiT-type zinc finger domain-containing protein
MADANATKPMKCSIKGCPGGYEPSVITHTVRQDGHVVVIDHVPAEVCDVCGDTLLQPKTLRQLETLLKRAQPASSVPLYEYA